jgi:hypothetical protein
LPSSSRPSCGWCQGQCPGAKARSGRRRRRHAGGRQDVLTDLGTNARLFTHGCQTPKRGLGLRVLIGLPAVVLDAAGSLGRTTRVDFTPAHKHVPVKTGKFYALQHLGFLGDPAGIPYRTRVQQIIGFRRP